MRADFFRPEAPDEVVGVAEWDGFRARIVDASENADRSAIERIFRVTPVAIDDPSRRHPGTRGPVVTEPGDLNWFLAAARVRGTIEGLSVRFSTDRPGGWDPAAYYRSLRAWVDRGERSRGSSQGSEAPPR